MPASQEKNISPKLEWFAATGVTLAIVWLHFHFWQNAGGLWRDEVNLVNLAGAPSFAGMNRDSFPILMPLLVKIWLKMRTTDLWLRLLGMIFGLAIPTAFWVVALVTRRPPLFSLVLFGLNSLLICYGDSLRAYGLGTALIVLALAGVWWFLQNPTWLRAAVFALVATLSVQTLYQNAILFFAVCLGGFAVCARQKNFPAALKIFCAGGVAAISLLPYYENFIGLPQSAIELRRGFSPFIANLNFEIATGFPFESFAVVWKTLAVVAIGCTVFSLFRKNAAEKNEETNLSLFASVTLVTVVILFIGFLWFAAAGARPWYFIPPLALAAACFDFGISLSCLPRLVRAAVFGFLIGTALIALPSANSDLRGHFTNVDRLAARVAASSSTQDFIVVTPWFCGISFDRYFSGRTNWNTLPPLTDHSIHRYDLVLDAMKDTNSLALMLEKISATLRSGHRVWVVGLMNMPPAGAMEPPLLPPPPLKDYGWSDTPYTGSWAARTGFFLSRHSGHFEELQVDNADANFQENLHLFMAQGWRE
jgi:hypothetical protein